MSQTIKLEGWVNTGTGRRAAASVDAIVQAGVIVSPGGGSALIVSNQSGSDMSQDDLVYVTGVTSDGVAEISLADANVDDAPAAYFLPAAILAGATGLAYVSGLSVATLNTNAATVDDPVYLSETAGGWTLTPPTAAGSRVEEVGRVAVKSATVGQILWKTGAGYGSIGTNEIQDEAVTVGKMADLATGSILSGQATRPAALDVSGDGEILVGDGTDVNAVAVTGSVGLTNAGVTTLTKGLEDIGRAAVGAFYLTGVAADTETVVINGRTYEFLNGSGLTGDVAVDITGDQTADAACIALAAAINGDAGAVVQAVVWADNNDTTSGVSLVALDVATATNYTLATTAGNGVVNAVTLTGAAAAAQWDVLVGQYTLTTADITLLALAGGDSLPIAGFASVTPPSIISMMDRTAAGAIVSMATVVVSLQQADANYWILTIDDPSTVLTDTDIISFVLAV